MTIKNFKKGKS